MFFQAVNPTQSQVHLQVSQANSRPKPAKELAFPITRTDRKDVANALYNGQEIKVNDETHTITPDKSGTGWVFFKNTDENNKVKGHLIIDATNKRKDAVSRSIINATQTVSEQ